MNHPNMPERITTTLDDIDHVGLLKRLRQVRDALKGGTMASSGGDTATTIIDSDGRHVAFRRTTTGMRMEVDPSAAFSAIVMIEDKLPDHLSTVAPRAGGWAAVVVDRWVDLLSLARYRSWPNQHHADDPCHVHADAAASLLAVLNPDALGHSIMMPLPNRYMATGQITIGDRPVFAKAISDRLTAAAPVTARLSRDGTHSYRIGVPDAVIGVCAMPDTMNRLRLLAEVEGIARPLLKAGMEAGS